MIRRMGLWLVVLTLNSGAEAAAPPGKTRELTPQEQIELNALEARADRHARAGEFEEVAKTRRQIADYRRTRQGARHWRTVDARFAVDEWRQLASLPARVRPDVLRAQHLNREGLTLLEKGQHRAAEKSIREALQLRRRVLGEDHPETAQSYNSVAGYFDAIGRHSDALPLYRKALRICQQAHGQDHPTTATCLNNLAESLGDLGKPSEALGRHRDALSVRQKVLGEVHPETADSYANLAGVLSELGRWSEALSLSRRALEIRLRTLGERDTAVATSHYFVANILDAMGKSREAFPFHKQGLQIRRSALGEDHPDTTASYNSLAICLQHQGRSSVALLLLQRTLRSTRLTFTEDHPRTATAYSNVAFCTKELQRPEEALPFFQKAFRVRQTVLGERHPETATSAAHLGDCLRELGRLEEAILHFEYARGVFEKSFGEDDYHALGATTGLAHCLLDQGKRHDAYSLFSKVLRLRVRTLGENHPHCAESYNGTAYLLQLLGRPEEALPLYRNSLRIKRRTFGEDHPSTAGTLTNLAVCLASTGEVSQAARIWQQSMVGQEAARFHLVHGENAGFDRAIALSNRFDARVGLADLLARLKQPRNAFAQAEASLARALLDDLVPARKSDGDPLRKASRRLEQPAPTQKGDAGVGDSDKEQRLSRAVLRERQASWSDMGDSPPEALTSRALPLERIQRSIPDRAALVFWVDAAELGTRWACVVRSTGIPRWVALPGTGPKGLVSDQDRSIPNRLYRSLAKSDSDEQTRSDLSRAFARQLFDPVRGSLQGVEHLFVVPTGPLAYMPADLVAEGFSVSYIPSGTVLALTRENHRPVGSDAMLALGDPIFDKGPPPEPPSSGLLLLSVLPGAFAAKAGLLAGDVLLSVGETKLDSIDDLRGALAALPANAEVWREGKSSRIRLQGSPLGATFDPRSARAAFRAWWRERGALQRGTGHNRLPGTRLEVEAISAMMKGSKTLLGGDASEQALDDLLVKGELKKYRLLHFATHGEIDSRNPKRSSLILAQNRLPDPAAQLEGDQQPYDGRLTVSRIRTEWKGELDADLVVLSACETGLGRDAGGDGLLGFAQAFLSVGARSVVLSRWKVDDTATSLLMVRFYENLLGKRKGVKPMGRAASLAEAKKWLRALPRKEAERLAALHAGGVLRGSVVPEKVPDGARPVVLKGDRPFEHPYFWAAWTLLGDPD